MNGMTVVPGLASPVLFYQVIHKRGFGTTTDSPIVTSQVGLYVFEDVGLNLFGQHISCLEILLYKFK